MAPRDINFSSESGNITAISWDDETGDLTVTFNHGGTYVYSNVPETTAMGFENSPSAGGWLNSQIKGLYPYRKLG